MPLRLFRPTAHLGRRPPCVTVRSDGRLTFNAPASRALNAARLQHVLVFGDPATKRVELRPAKEPGPNTHLITYIKPAGVQIRATLEARPFLTWLGYYDAPSQQRDGTGAPKPSGSLRFRVNALRKRVFTFNLSEPFPVAPAEASESTSNSEC